MSDEHQPDHQPRDEVRDQADDPAPDQRPAAAIDAPRDEARDEPALQESLEEPTQPLAGWRATQSAGEAAEPADQPTDQPTGQPTDQPTGQPTVQPEGRAYGAGGDAAPSGMLSGPPPHPAPFGGPGREQAAPTVPLQHPNQQPGQHPNQQPGPGWFGPGPYPPRPMYAPPPAPTRKLALWVWPAVACLALVVGILGGLAGGALQDELASQRGTNDNGLGGVRTRAAAPLDAENGSVAAVAQALLPSTVQIVAELDGQAGGATGSGFVLDRDGHVVTNNHVVASAAEGDGPILVIGQSGERLEATVVGRSPVYDLAVLSVDEADGLEPAALGASQALNVGESVVAFGAPLGLSQTVTSGIVSALNRPVTTSGESDDESSYINAVQTDAAINPGNSGGPLVNLAGEVVGVNSAIATTGGATRESGNIGVGFAIPIEQVRTTVDQILRTGKAEYPVIGAQVRTGGEPDAEGATITEVMPDTPAARAGLEADDVIVAVDDQPVSDGIALIVAIRTHLPGETVEMSVVRGGEERIVEVELDGKVG
ncbi:trypsin-like peptidase domain-containing protein [Nocardioides ganghwensis]|uniref:trypsin-like peptidase domain-containing protein n=1 Tax=Nocardioides ganghwensis TaxID=252230 RepID=UPI0013EB70C1|nr:trypsin-like peptidase domain-containing protein [Nocardioides ganghwensis]MBD3944396.1 trypsin-like peptidase domain-containing protein [Nocardioides ganghwensis]